MDRISELPESIVHHILSFFNTYRAPMQLVRMSVLSKRWFHLTASFPVLDFTINDFANVSRGSFFKYVEYTVTRFCHQNVTAQKFKIIATLWKDAELDVVNTCLELVLQKGVQELTIIITIPPLSFVPEYRLPNILLSVSMLKSLTISDCKLPSSLMVDVVNFKSLIRLRLENVSIDEEVIKNLTTSCPLLQVFQIIDCHGLKVFCVHGHKNLRTVEISFDTPLERIDIEAPNLSQLLVVADLDERVDPQMNFVSKFDLEDIECRTPNLVSFVYACKSCIPWPLNNVHSFTSFKPCMQCYFRYFTDAMWFRKLRKFLDQKNGFKVLNLYINAIYIQNFGELVKLKVIELPLYELEHVELQLDTFHVAFVDAILCCFRPRSLTLRSYSPSDDIEEQSDIVKFTYEKLLAQEDQGRTKIQIVTSSSCEDQQHPWARPCKEKGISFIKEEGTLLLS